MLGAVIKIAVVCAAALGGYVFYYNQETREFQNTEREYPRSSSSSQRPARRRTSSNTTCPICMNEIEYSFNRLPCDHKLHMNCYRDLVRNINNRRCPLCRESF